MKCSTVSADKPIATDEVISAISLCDNVMYSKRRDMISVVNDKISTPMKRPKQKPTQLKNQAEPPVCPKEVIP